MITDPQFVARHRPGPSCVLVRAGPTCLPGNGWLGQQSCDLHRADLAAHLDAVGRCGVLVDPSTLLSPSVVWTSTSDPGRAAGQPEFDGPEAEWMLGPVSAHRRIAGSSLRPPLDRYVRGYLTRGPRRMRAGVRQA